MKGEGRNIRASLSSCATENTQFHHSLVTTPQYKSEKNTSVNANRRRVTVTRMLLVDDEEYIRRFSGEELFEEGKLRRSCICPCHFI